MLQLCLWSSDFDSALYRVPLAVLEHLMSFHIHISDFILMETREGQHTCLDHQHSVFLNFQVLLEHISFRHGHICFCMCLPFYYKHNIFKSSPKFLAGLTNANVYD